jgi:hypothetical protein
MDRADARDTLGLCFESRGSTANSTRPCHTSPYIWVNSMQILDLFRALKRIWSVSCEGLMLLRMLTVVAFSLLVAAGAMGFLG